MGQITFTQGDQRHAYPYIAAAARRQRRNRRIALGLGAFGAALLNGATYLASFNPAAAATLAAAVGAWAALSLAYRAFTDR